MVDDCSKHSVRVIGFDGSLDDLAEHILGSGDLHPFLHDLAYDLRCQADADSARNRFKLASKLYSASEHLYDACAGSTGLSGDLARRVGFMRYDSLERFLTYLADRVVTNTALYKARDSVHEAWKVCEPHMKNDS